MMMSDMAGGTLVRIRLSGFPLWVVQQYTARTGQGEKQAFEYILQRWAKTDPDAQPEFGVSLDAYRQATEGAQVIPIRKPKPGREAQKDEGKKGNGNGAT
jgi:hypothetical protein